MEEDSTEMNSVREEEATKIKSMMEENSTENEICDGWRINWKWKTVIEEEATKK